MRLKGGWLWRPDPLRNAVRACLDEMEPQPQEPLPTRAIQSLRPTLTYDPETGPPGALFDMPAKLAELSAENNAVVLLVGARGMGKGPQLQWLYRDVARRFLDDELAAPAPVMLTLREIAEARSVADGIDRSLSKLAGTPPHSQAWGARPLLLIIDGDEELGEQDLREALWLVKEFRQGSQHRFVISLDEGSRDLWNQDLEPTAVLVAKPMDFGRVCLYLKRLNTPAANQLHDVIEQRRCRDIAGTPWLLQRMIELSQRKVTFDSRATLLRQIANECLGSITMGGVPRFCAERALEQVGWLMQSGRQSILGGADLYRILADVRGNREFRLGDLKDLLIRSGILAPAGEDAVRFRYQSLQAFYAARYLAASPDRERLLEDITASLGRFARARWWEKTLVTMAGLDGPSSKGILSAILAGSPLVEGEQVYLAARCYLEVREAGPPAGLVDQIADALIWRSHPGNLRPYADRKRAVSALVELRHPNAIPHLVSLACDRVAVGWGTEKRYEFSGIRLIAVNGLTLMRDEATAYVLEKRPTLAAVMNAWWAAYGQSKIDGLIEELHRNDAATSPIAAFALGFFDLDLARDTLLAVFADDDADRDVGWAVADTFASLDPQWVSRNVLEPRLDQFVDPRVPYLVGRMGTAAEGTAQRRYLTECFEKGTPAVQARALRAFGELREPAIRPLCEAVAGNDWDAARRLGLKLPEVLPEDDRNRLRTAAMESLREIGNADSIETLRKSRLGGTMTITLRQLSFDVAEDIYWRLTAGLSNDSGEAPHTTGSVTERS
jgi:HEAT repeat protein